MTVADRIVAAGKYRVETKPEVPLVEASARRMIATLAAGHAATVASTRSEEVRT
jgi:hypothetical protein